MPRLDRTLRNEVFLFLQNTRLRSRLVFVLACPRGHEAFAGSVPAPHFLDLEGRIVLETLSDVLAGEEAPENSLDVDCGLGLTVQAGGGLVL